MLVIIARRITSSSIVIVEDECLRKLYRKNATSIKSAKLKFLFSFLLQRATEDCCPARKAWICTLDVPSNVKDSRTAIALATMRSDSLARASTIGN